MDFCKEILKLVKITNIIGKSKTCILDRIVEFDEILVPTKSDPSNKLVVSNNDVDKVEDLCLKIYKNLGAEDLIFYDNFKNVILNLIFSNQFDINSIKSFLDKRKRKILIHKKIYGLSMNKPIILSGDYVITRDIKTLKTEGIDFSKNIDNQNEWEYCYDDNTIIFGKIVESIDAINLSKKFKEEYFKFIGILRFMSYDYAMVHIRDVQINSKFNIIYSKGENFEKAYWQYKVNQNKIVVDDLVNSNTENQILYKYFVDSKSLSKLNEKILFSISWFSKAMAEEDTSAALLSLSTAFECLLSYSC